MWFLNIVACGLMAAGGFIGFWQYNKLQGKEVAIGRVMALPASESSEGALTYGIEAMFSDRAGNAHRYCSGWTTSSPGYRVGDAIRIYFDRGSPEKCGLCSFGGRFAIAWFIFLAGAGLFLGVCGMRYGNKFMEQTFPVTVNAGIEPRAIER